MGNAPYQILVNAHLISLEKRAKFQFVLVYHPILLMFVIMEMEHVCHQISAFVMMGFMEISVNILFVSHH